MDASSEIAHYEARLTEVRNQIARARKTASYSTGDVSVSRQALESLIAEEGQILARLDLLKSIQRGGTAGVMRARWS